MASHAPRLCRVTARSELGAGYFLTEIEQPDIATTVRAGQFVMVRLPGRLEPLLSRPFSVFAVVGDEDRPPSRFSLVYAVVGRGTEAIAAVPPGGELAVLGPLGHGFDLTPPPSQALLVAGGTGIASLFLLAATLVAQAVPARLLYGARSAHQLVVIDRFEQLGVTVETATDDGTHGHHGLVTSLLEDRLAVGGSTTPTVYACGPTPMLARVRELTLERRIRCLLALEARMACGFGVCLGCAVRSATEAGSYRLVCTDGPCMSAAEVLL